MSMKSRMHIFIALIFLSTMIIPSASAVACSDAGSFSSLCGLFTNISNLLLAVLTIVFTGENATIIIYAAVVLAVVIFFIDLMRGEHSYIGRKLRKI